ncbi:MAG TPA: hypothetical protein VLV78_04885 [Thermoanaerobaculia bacterium]|nr:hypothetical protein [Thermoanaerobaculia bacterium]
MIAIAIKASSVPSPGKVIPAGSPAGASIASGTVGDAQNRCINKARAFLTMYNAAGVELARIPLRVNDDGWFLVRTADLPRGIENGPATISADGSEHLAASTAVTFTNENGTFKMAPSEVHLRLVSFNPWLTMVVLMPGLFGLILALLHLTSLSQGLRVTQLYAVGTAALWGIVLALLLAVYAEQGHALIALFWPDLFISSGVVVFALIGYLTYVAFSLEEKDRELLFDGTPREKQHILLTLGGRLLIAPYVALTGYAIFAATFKSLNTGAFAAFFGFFTGVWIKPVLTALNAIGVRLLSKEEQEKVAQQALSGPSRPSAIASAELLTPSPAFFKAVQDARRELLALDGVWGVDAGVTTSGPSHSQERAIVVYVDKKRELDPSDAAFVPTTFAGYRTSVEQLPAAPGPGICYSAMLSVSHDKIARRNGGFGTKAPHTKPSIAAANGAWVLLDEQKRLFFDSTEEVNFFDAQNAYLLAAPAVGTADDFVAFVIDSDSGLPPKGDYCVCVRSDASGLGLSTPPPDRWKSAALRSVQVHTGVPYLRTALHEIVHSWLAYGDLAIPTSKGARILRTDEHHWHDYFDYADSCMNESRKVWTPVTDRTAKRVYHTSDGPAFGLCPLDLYFMGLIGRDDVGSLRFFSGAPVGDVFTVIDQLSPSLLPERISARSNTSFRQTWIVVTADADSGERLAADLAGRFDEFERNFSRASGNRARLLISRTKGTKP